MIINIKIENVINIKNSVFVSHSVKLYVAALIYITMVDICILYKILV